MAANWYISYNSSIAPIVLVAKPAELTVLIYLLLILIVTGLSLAAILWAGTYFFQGYIYTQPSAGIFWQAPAAAAVLTFGYTIWCLSIALSSSATPQNIPIDTVFRFTAKEDMPELNGRPSPKIWAIKKDRRKTGDDLDGEKVAYVVKRDDRGRFIYKENVSIRPGPWQARDVIAIEIEMPDQSKVRFDVTPTEDRDYKQFVSKDGWVIREYEDGPTGLPVKFRFFRLLWNVIFNFAHYLGWFLGLWLLLRFQWTHALGLAVPLWLIVTLFVLPMLLGYAGLVAANRHVATALLMGLGQQAQG